MTTDFNQIPVIDFGPFLNGTLEEKTQVAEEIGDACRHVGFFYLKNYGIAPEVTQDALNQVRQFFSLPLEKKKETLVGSPETEARGYTPMFEQKLDENTPDIKESFHIGLDLPLDKLNETEKTLKCYGPNLWIKDMPEFRKALYDGYFLAVLQLCERLLQAFALALHLPEHYFAPLTEKPMVEFSVYRYPPQPRDNNSNMIGCGEHTDYGCFSLLSQSDVTALQVKNKKGEWIDARPIENTIVINIADTMQRWTNDVFVSTIHRVINRNNVDRYSMAFFFGPNPFASVECLSTCCNSTNPAKYEPVLAGEYIMGKIEKIIKK
ncbi:unnamed protein product [Adineta steineri]|uniref:Fe2OG dioxygenase domain-containing protein n=1 Tax=Adineta steineri TaxID=433720 RepID=A0A814VGY9_9BILA|nr:unnamed protein product [Adineta steineri]CAF3824559.1 unnamed protein product [Adineta steineri]